MAATDREDTPRRQAPWALPTAATRAAALLVGLLGCTALVVARARRASVAGAAAPDALQWPQLLAVLPVDYAAERAGASYDSALARIDDEATSEFEFERAQRQYAEAGFNSSEGLAALVIIREVLRHQAPLMRTAGFDSGLWVTRGSTLRKRIAAAAAQFGRACLRADVTLVGCAVASLEARFLQEWVTWHLFVAGFTHLVVYNNVGAGVGGDNTPQVLRPFVDAGVVTVKPWAPHVQYDTALSDAQGAAYRDTVERMRAVSCRYVHGDPFNASLQPCSEEEIAGAHAAPAERTMWVTAIDIDEFLVTRDPAACVTDVLRRLRDEAGLAVPWRVFGHSGHLMAGRDTLVTEAYTERIPGNPLNQHVKTLANMRFLLHFEGPHIARYAGGRVAVDEFGAPVAEPLVPSPPAEAAQTIFLHHYQPKSVEDGVLKWVRGRASIAGDYGVRIRDPGHLPQYVRDGDFARRVADTTALAGAAMVRAILRPPPAPSPRGRGAGGH